MIQQLNKLIVKALMVGFLATLIASVYILIYFNLIVDFSDGKGILSWLTKLVAYNTLFAFIFSFIHFGLIEKIARRLSEKLKSLIFSGVLITFSFVVVFSILLMNDPVFTSEDAQLMADFFKGFLMPLSFIPFLSWYSIQLYFKS